MASAKHIAKIDEEHLAIIRASVGGFMARCASKYDRDGAVLLDVAPQCHEGAAPYFKKAAVRTLDIDPASGATYIADLCANNERMIPSASFDFIVCTEVLEHTRQPFDAVQEIRRLMKRGALAFVTTPFNFRIHGPLPDCWRFTEHGLRALFDDFEIVELSSIETKDRFLMPVHYTLTAARR